jgi:hypothetical protein
MTEYEDQLQREVLKDRTCGICKDKAAAMHVWFQHGIKLHEYAIPMCTPCYRLQQTVDILKSACALSVNEYNND